MTSAQAFATDLQTDEELQAEVEDHGIETVIEENGYEFTPAEVEQAIRDIIIDSELPNASEEEIDTVQAIYTLTHVCTCKCTISC